MRITVLDRIHERHPELSEKNVVTAFRSVMIDAERSDGTWIAIGLDDRGRNVELIYKKVQTGVIIYHAFTPPTKKIQREIARLRGIR